MNGIGVSEDEIIGDIPEAPASLADLTKRAAELKTAIDDHEAQAAALGKEFTAVKEELLRALDLSEVDSIRGHGFLFFKENRSTVQTPKTPEDKEQLFQFLRDKGIFLEIASVNSQTLNSLYKNLSEDAAKEGNLDFRLPGVAAPTNSINLKMRRG